ALDAMACLLCYPPMCLPKSKMRRMHNSYAPDALYALPSPYAPNAYALCICFMRLPSCILEKLYAPNAPPSTYASDA
ncbi:hypothetical protein Tco_0789229, partial [Tanacetum coccineum]